MSGFELVPAGRGKLRRGKPATLRQFAKIDFKPWKREPGMRKEEFFPSSSMLDDHGVTCRMAYAIMLMSRDELIAMHSKIDHEHVDEMMGNLTETSEFLKEVAHMVEAAYVRVLASASAALVQNRPFKGVTDTRARKAVRS
jgi:hypothetical protein